MTEKLQWSREGGKGKEQYSDLWWGKFEKVISSCWPASLGARFFCFTPSSTFEIRQRLIHLHSAVLFLRESRTKPKTLNRNKYCGKMLSAKFLDFLLPFAFLKPDSSSDTSCLRQRDISGSVSSPCSQQLVHLWLAPVFTSIRGFMHSPNAIAVLALIVHAHNLSFSQPLFPSAYHNLGMEEVLLLMAYVNPRFKVMVLSLPSSGVITFKILNNQKHRNIPIYSTVKLRFLHPNHPSYVNTCNYKLQIPVAAKGKSAAWPVGGKHV